MCRNVTVFWCHNLQETITDYLRRFAIKIVVVCLLKTMKMIWKPWRLFENNEDYLKTMKIIVVCLLHSAVSEVLQYIFYREHILQRTHCIETTFYAQCCIRSVACWVCPSVFCIFFCRLHNDIVICRRQKAAIKTSDTVLRKRRMIASCFEHITMSVLSAANSYIRSFEIQKILYLNYYLQNVFCKFLCQRTVTSLHTTTPEVLHFKASDTVICRRQCCE